MINLDDRVYLFCRNNNLTPMLIDTDDGIAFWAGIEAELMTDYSKTNPPFVLDEEPVGKSAVLCSDVAYCLENDASLPYRQFERLKLTPYMVDIISRKLENYTEVGV